MRVQHKIWLLLFALPLALVQGLAAQTPAEPINYKYHDHVLKVEVDASLGARSLDSLLALVGSSRIQTDSLKKAGLGNTNESGWALVECSEEKIVYEKNVRNLKGKTNGKKSLWDLGGLFGSEATGYAANSWDFGVNALVLPVIQQNGRQVTFNLPGYPEAEKVYLAGSFNDWSNLANPMRKVGNLWTVTLPLEAGKHQYKFVIDGNWTLDKSSSLQEEDGWGHLNNVYYKTNHIFRLPGHPEAEKVMLAGSFNNWDPEQLALQKTPQGWELPVYLADGRYEYKFIVDGSWMVDPANPKTTETVEGYENSVLLLGNLQTFLLADFPEANHVSLVGDFTNWKKNALDMEKGTNGWTLDYVLPVGNHLYQFLVDGEPMADPDNPHSIGRKRGRKSLLSVEPNVSFSLKGNSGAKTVYLTGTFNNWSEEGYTMEFKDGKWEIDLQLPKGKVLYKFIVDGEWIRDPANQLWEKNEFNTENSVLWVE